ncbi:MAG: DnaA regulatory inactivator Hda [Acidihalobacter sp.]|jgi:DnaA family protein
MSDQLALNVSLRADATFETFVPAPSQQELGGALQAFACAQGSEQQWYLWGAPQTGKTHLAQAACHAAGDAGGAVAYLPLAELGAHGAGLLEGMDRLDLLVIDDVDRVWLDSEWARSLFGLVNAVREHGGRLLFTAAEPPAQALLPDLRSRLLWGPVYQLQRLEDDGLQVLAGRAAAARGFALGVNEVQYLLRHGPREPRALIALLERIDQASLRAKRRVTVPFIRSVLVADGPPAPMAPERGKTDV